MPFDWREFLIVAHSLRKETSEGVQRTCIGRTYYYVYNLGLAKLEPWDSRNNRQAYIRSFGSGVKTMRIKTSDRLVSGETGCIPFDLMPTIVKTLSLI